VTLTRLGITGNLRTTLQSTNAIESMISILRRTSRNVKRWQSGDMCLRWTVAGMLEAEQQFRRIIGYSDLAKLALAVERDITTNRSSTTSPKTAEPAATLVTA
jgi:transposase-like protein